MKRMVWKLLMLSLGVAALAGAPGCLAAVGSEEDEDEATSGVGLEEEVGSAGQALSSSDLSMLVLGGVYPVTQGYHPNGGHAGIDFGGTNDGQVSVWSPVNGTIIANTGACGKVAIYDGANTIIMAHMSHRTSLPVGSHVSVGTYLGKASRVVGGGCSASGPHLHMEIRTGHRATMADPNNNNTATTLNPLTYTYGGFPAVSLLSPANGGHGGGNPVSFSWSPIQGATRYRLQISTSGSFGAESCPGNCIYNEAAGSTSRSVSLAPGQTYYWRVRAGNSATGQGGLWSEVRSVHR